MKPITMLRRLTCRHRWYKAAVFQEVDPAANIRYPLRRYVCEKCGKVSHQDGRRDHLEKKAICRP